MSQMGQTRRFDGGHPTSGLAKPADIIAHYLHVSNVPKPEVPPSHYAKKKPPEGGSSIQTC
jgi:hypothetical protein